MCMPTNSWSRGIAVGASLAAASFALAVTFGAYAVHAGLSPAVAIALSALVFSGSAQFAFVTVLASGVWPALGAAALMNARFLPMAATCASALRGGRLRRALEAQCVVDGSWAAAQQPDGTVDRGILIPATLVQWPVWIAGTAVGSLFAPSMELTHQLGLDAVFPAFFAVLLLDVARQRPAMRPLLAGGAAFTAAGLWVAPEGLALLASAAPALLASPNKEDS